MELLIDSNLNKNLEKDNNYQDSNCQNNNYQDSNYQDSDYDSNIIENISKIKFRKFNTKGLCNYNKQFNIYIDDTKTIIFKKKKSNNFRKVIKNNLNNYKNIILNKNSGNICSVKSFDVENDGSYKCKYIHGFTLYQIYHIEKIDKSIKNSIIKEKLNIINAIQNLIKLIPQIKSGDWHINNLVYSLEEQKIYNVDCEGYFKYHNYGLYSDILKKKLNKIIKSIA